MEKFVEYNEILKKYEKAKENLTKYYDFLSETNRKIGENLYRMVITGGEDFSQPKNTDGLVGIPLRSIINPEKLSRLLADYHDNKEYLGNAYDSIPEETKNVMKNPFG